MEVNCVQSVKIKLFLFIIYYTGPHNTSNYTDAILHSPIIIRTRLILLYSFYRPSLFADVIFPPYFFWFVFHCTHFYIR